MRNALFREGNGFCKCIGFTATLIVGGIIPTIAQSTTFDYMGDTERVPAEITLGIKAGEYEFVESEHLVLEQKQSGSVVHMKEFNTTTSPGDPMLPVRIYEIALPPNVDWGTLKLSVEPGETTILPGQFEILPAPPLLARVEGQNLVDWGEGKDIVAGRNMNVYARDSFFPQKPVRIVSRSQLRKWRFVRIEFSPVQYNPKKQSLRLMQAAKIRISFLRIGKEVFRSDPLLADTLMDDEAKKRFVNYKQAREWYRYVPKPDSGVTAEDPDYVIVTTNAIRDRENSTKLADFVAHKTALGHAARIVTEDDYGAVRDAVAIREWLKDNYATLGIHYVLLIGDPDPDDPEDPNDSVGDVPMMMGWPHRADHRYRESPTDYFFADLTGKWDLDGDGYYGEHQAVDNTSPNQVVGTDGFSARWTGKIEADTDGIYSFFAVSDNGLRLMIDGTTRMVKILMRHLGGNISEAHLTVPYNQLIRRHLSLLS